jgi:hypothetical protein
VRGRRGRRGSGLDGCIGRLMAMEMFMVDVGKWGSLERDSIEEDTVYGRISVHDGWSPLLSDDFTCFAEVAWARAAASVPTLEPTPCQDEHTCEDAQHFDRSES